MRKRYKVVQLLETGFTTVKTGFDNKKSAWDYISKKNLLVWVHDVVEYEVKDAKTT